MSIAFGSSTKPYTRSRSAFDREPYLDIPVAGPSIGPVLKTKKNCRRFFFFLERTLDRKHDGHAPVVWQALGIAVGMCQPCGRHVVGMR